jgi:beta-glucanase (GH16 family)
MKKPFKKPSLFQQLAKKKLAVLVILIFTVTGSTLVFTSFAATTPLVGDLNNDGAVNLTDLSMLLSNYGKTTGTTPPTPPPTTPPPGTTHPPASDGTTAAATFGWGTPVKSDDMNDLSGWGKYDDAGNQFGKRSSGQITSSNGTAIISGQSGGKTGGMAMNFSQFRGRWEVRQKVGGSASCWRPVLLLWPDAEDWPVGGEVDYAENPGSTLSKVNFFLHYGASNSQTSGSVAVDMSQYHNYAVEWTAAHIRGYVDGKQFFEDTNTSHLPPRSMHATVQLDGSQSCGGTTQQIVDWVRVYK